MTILPETADHSNQFNSAFRALKSVYWHTECRWAVITDRHCILESSEHGTIHNFQICSQLRLSSQKSYSLPDSGLQTPVNLLPVCVKPDMAEPQADNSKTDWISFATKLIRKNVTWPIGSSETMHLIFHTCLAVKLDFLAKAMLQLDDNLPGFI